MDAETEALREADKLLRSRSAAPIKGNVYLNMLTPIGLHFGYETFETLAKESMGKAIINPATQLMVRLTKKR